MKIQALFIFVVLAACSAGPSVKKSMVDYEVVGNGIARFDNAPSYIILIKETVPGSGFKDSIKSIIDEFAGKVGSAKFSLDIYDNPEVAKVVMETVVSQKRLYTKDEGKQMNQHWAASYTGELMIDGKPALVYGHQLDFFPDIKHAVKRGPRVEQQESMEYLPQ